MLRGVTMPRMSIYIPDKLLEKIKEKFPDINCAGVARKSIIKKLELLEAARLRGLL